MQFYQACWEKAHSGAEPRSPEQAAQWGACQPTAEAGFYGAGFVFAGNPDFAVNPELTAVLHACPSQYNDMFAEDLWRVSVGLIQDGGGPLLRDRFLPAASLIKRTLNLKWPDCAMTARSNGIPRIVSRNGKWEFQTVCVPCDAERKAIAESVNTQKHAEESQASIADIFAELVTKAAEPRECTAPAALMSDPKASKWEKDKAEFETIQSKECQVARAAQKQGTASSSR